MSIGKWNDRYQAGEQVFKSPAPLVVEFAGHLAPGSALDLASGPGRNALYLAERGWRVTALDGSPVAIDLLRHRAREQNLSVEAKVIDLEAHRPPSAAPNHRGTSGLAAPEASPLCASSSEETGEFEIPANAFDLVLSCYYFQRGLIPQMKSALRPGGLLIAIAHLTDPGQSKDTAIRAHPSELPALFDGWSILHYREGEPGESCHRHAGAELVVRRT
jgi:tellurite methyltransferase